MEGTTSCERCGSREVRYDEVTHAETGAGQAWGSELLEIGECLRCALRWTSPLRRAPLRAAVARPGLPGKAAAERGTETIAA